MCRMKRQYHIIGACSCWGAQIHTCERGPETLAEEHIFERLQREGIAVREIEMLYPEQRIFNAEIPLASSLPLIYDFNLHLARRVRRVIQEGSFPIVLGGDHVNAVGTWNGVPKPCGLIWIDAHMDSHTFETSPSKAYHGMPLAALLGHGVPELARLESQEPVLEPQNVVLIGVRSFEEGEAALLKKLNVKIYFMDEVKKRGLKEILPEAIGHVTRHVPRYGLSLDLDAFTIQDAPGVGSPEKGGICADEFLQHFPLIVNDPKWAACEIVEFNPSRDINHKTRELIFKILQTVMVY